MSITPEEIKKFGAFIIVVIIVMAILVPIGGAYNSLVQKDVTCEQMKANVQTALERRADLVPNLVSTIEGSAAFEHDTLTDVISARGQATKIKEQIASAQTVEDLQASQNELGAVIGRLLLVYEQYPVLQTTVSFKELQAQLTATENQINAERNNYNAAVTDYKVTCRAFPSVVIARIFGFNENKWSMFQVYEGKGEVPVVKFDL